MEEITNPLVQAMLDDLQLNATAELVEKITTPHRTPEIH